MPDGWNYYHLLEEHADQTDWSELEVKEVLTRIKNILDQLPATIKQAHERIILKYLVVYVLVQLPNCNSD